MSGSSDAEVLLSQLIDALAERTAALVAARLPQPAPAAAAPSKLLYTPHEAARLLSVGHSTLEAWRHSGRGPRYVKLGHSVRYRHTDLQRWLEREGRK